MLSAPVWSDTNFSAVFGALRRTNQANVAEVITRTTGGKRLSFVRRRAVEEAFAAIGEELHGQYLLTFTPQPSSVDTFRPIGVSIRNRPDLRVRSRNGYWVTAEK